MKLPLEVVGAILDGDVDACRAVVPFMSDDVAWSFCDMCHWRDVHDGEGLAGAEGTPLPIHRPDRPVPLRGLQGVEADHEALSYEGFNSIIRGGMKAIGRHTLLSDLACLLSFYYLRGANVTKLRDKARAHFKSEEAYTKVCTLINQYTIFDRPKGRMDTITLPRISLSYPGPSLHVLSHLIILSKAKTAKEWLMGSNCLPHVIEPGTEAWREYIDHQARLSAKYKRGKSTGNERESSPTTLRD